MPCQTPSSALRAEARAQALDLKRDGSACQSCVAGMHARFDRRSEALTAAMEAQGLRLDCRKGCAACCHSLVGVLPAEAFRLARHIAGLDGPECGALEARSRAHHSAHGRLDGAARLRARIACPMLDPETRACSVHPARPLTCRAMNSVDAGACNATLGAGGAEIRVPSVLAFHEALQTQYDAHARLAEHRGFDAAPLELSAALVAIWDHADAEARWMAGENIFEGCWITDLADGIPQFRRAPACD